MSDGGGGESGSTVPNTTPTHKQSLFKVAAAIDVHTKPAVFDIIDLFKFKFIFVFIMASKASLKEPYIDQICVYTRFSTFTFKIYIIL